MNKQSPPLPGAEQTLSHYYKGGTDQFNIFSSGIGYLSFSVILSSNSMNSLNWIQSDVSMKQAGHHKKCKMLP